jgi:hypothetical protein
VLPLSCCANGERDVKGHDIVSFFYLADRLKLRYLPCVSVNAVACA